MRAANPVNASDDADAELADGAGQVDSCAAVNTGLDYHIETGDRAPMLCNQGYTTTDVKTHSWRCKQLPQGI